MRCFVKLFVKLQNVNKLSRIFHFFVILRYYLLNYYPNLVGTPFIITLVDNAIMSFPDCQTIWNHLLATEVSLSTKPNKQSCAKTQIKGYIQTTGLEIGCKLALHYIQGKKEQKRISLVSYQMLCNLFCVSLARRIMNFGWVSWRLCRPLPFGSESAAAKPNKTVVTQKMKTLI